MVQYYNTSLDTVTGAECAISNTIRQVWDIQLTKSPPPPLPRTLHAWTSSGPGPASSALGCSWFQIRVEDAASNHLLFACSITRDQTQSAIDFTTSITSSYVHCYWFLGVQYPTVISLGALWREQPTYCTKSLTLHCPRDTPILQGVHNSRCLYQWNHAISLTTLFHCKLDFHSWLVLLLVCKHRVYY